MAITNTIIGILRPSLRVSFWKPERSPSIKRAMKASFMALVLGGSSFCLIDGQSIEGAKYVLAETSRAPVPGLLRPLSLKDNESNLETVEPDYQLILRLLFPETATWTSINKMPTLGKACLTRIEGELRSAYLSSKLSNKHESKGCSFISRLFEDIDDYAGFFHEADIDSDGVDDIIYSGWALCTEGYVTIIWFGSDTHFVVRQESLWQTRTLSIFPDNPPRLGSVAVGCCSDPEDEYLLGTLVNPRMHGQRRITKHTTIPEVLLEPTKFRVRAEELVLRSSPKVEDQYDELASEFMFAAVFGNILSRYLPGMEGTILGQDKQGTSSHWYFVLLDGDWSRFRTHSPFGVNVGWVDASSITLLK